MLDKITPLILTYNEAPNIQRTLEKLTWANRIVVIDSFSTDETLSILQSFSQVDCIQRKFDSFAEQCNFGLTYIQTEWALSLDADYYLTDALIKEISQIQPNQQIDGYYTRFKYCIYGKALQGTTLPPRQVLYRKDKAKYQNDGHSHKVIVAGISQHLKNFIYHDDRKPLSRWLQSQDKYIKQESIKLQTTDWNLLSWPDRLRKHTILVPFIILFYCLILKRGLFDGWQGWYYTFQRMFAEILLKIRLMDDIYHNSKLKKD